LIINTLHRRKYSTPMWAGRTSIAGRDVHVVLPCTDCHPFYYITTAKLSMSPKATTGYGTMRHEVIMPYICRLCQAKIPTSPSQGKGSLV